jgi:hypothetical protein
MDTLIHADIFFFITSLAVIVLGVVLLVALVYVTAILRDVKHITAKVRAETDLITADIVDLRESLRKEGFALSKILGFVRGIFGRHKKPRQQKGRKNG